MKVTQKFGPQFRAAGRYEVGLYVEGDPDGRVHWEQFAAKSYDHADTKKHAAYSALALRAAARIQVRAAALYETARKMQDYATGQWGREE